MIILNSVKHISHDYCKILLCDIYHNYLCSCLFWLVVKNVLLYFSLRIPLKNPQSFHNVNIVLACLKKNNNTVGIFDIFLFFFFLFRPLQNSALSVTLVRYRQYNTGLEVMINQVETARKTLMCSSYTISPQFAVSSANCKQRGWLALILL